MRAVLPSLLLLTSTVAASACAPARSGPASPRDVVSASGPMIVLVRHAEKADAPADDPPLTAQGRERAEALADLLGRSGVGAVLSSDYRRTRETAAPLARAAGVDVELYDPRALDALAAGLRGREGIVVVVGHSNTTPALVEALGGEPGPPIVEATEYDRLYVVHPGPGSEAATLVLRFGRPGEPSQSRSPSASSSVSR